MRCKVRVHEGPPPRVSYGDSGEGFRVSRRGYYAWLDRPTSPRAIRDEQLKPHIRAIHAKSRQTYGSICIQKELAQLDIHAGHNRIARLRKEMHCVCIQRKKFKTTTNSCHDLPIAPNLLEQRFAITVPGTVWGTDITYIATDEGWLYLAGIKDFASREIVGYAMGNRMTVDLVETALAKAKTLRPPQLGCIHHSDRGSQYCALEYRGALERAGFRISMSRRGNCYDNAPTESFWGSLKQELVHHRHFATRLEAKAAIQEYIEIFYNRIRRHSSIGFVPPSVYAELFNQKTRLREGFVSMIDSTGQMPTPF